VEQCLRTHPRLAAEYQAMRAAAMACHRDRLSRAVAAAELTAGTHVARLQALETGLAALHTAVLSTGDDVETVAAGLGPAIAKRVMSLRNAGGKEAAASQKVKDEADAVVRTAADAAEAKRRAELFATAENITMAFVNTERMEAWPCSSSLLSSTQVICP